MHDSHVLSFFLQAHYHAPAGPNIDTIYSIYGPKIVLVPLRSINFGAPGVKIAIINMHNYYFYNITISNN